MIKLLKESKSVIFDLLQSIEVPPTDIRVWYELSATDFMGNAKNLIAKIDVELAKFERVGDSE